VSDACVNFPSLSLIFSNLSNLPFTNTERKTQSLIFPTHSTNILTTGQTMISEKDIRRAIRLAIKAKQIEKNPIIEEEEDFGVITVKEQPSPASPNYAFEDWYKKLREG
jgi:hypothetical protein